MGASLIAQRPEAPRITVMTLQSQEANLGAQAADVLRNRLSRDFSARQLQTLPTEAINPFLEQSGFPPNEALSPTDEKQLASLVRADYYVTGSITHTPAGFHVEPRLVLSRDLTLVQPLPVSDASKLDNAMSNVSHSVRDALKQIEGENKCRSLASSGNVPGALAAARSGVAAYPRATLARICVMNVFGSLHDQAKTHADSIAYADSALAASREIVQYDPANVPAYKLQSVLYKFVGDSVRARQALLGLVRADPTNTTQTVQVVNDLAASGNAKDAIPLVRELLEKNPGDAKMLNTAFLVYLYAHNWQGVTQVGPDLIKADTAMADTLYYTRIAVAYDSLNQPQKAAEQLAQGVAKFAGNADLWIQYARDLEKAGQLQQAREAWDRAGQLNPKIGLRLALKNADTLFKSGKYDSAYAILDHIATTAPDNKPVVASIALSYGSATYKKASGTKDRAEFMNALRFFKMSQNAAPTPAAQFFIGATNLGIMQLATTEAQASKSCQAAQLARAAYTEAANNLPAGKNDSGYATMADQMLEYLPQYRPAIESQVKVFCKSK